MKSFTMTKNVKGGPFGIFQHPFCRKTSYNLKGGPFGEFFSRKKSRNAKKTERGGPFGLIRYCMLPGKPFWFSSLGQRVQFGGFVKFCRTFGVELFWSFQVYRKKTLTKSHDYNRLFSKKAPTKKT